MLAGELQESRARGELPLAPGRDHSQLGGQGRVGQLEADLIVALAGSAVSHRVGALRPRDVHLGSGDQRSRDGGSQQVASLVHGVGPQHGKDEVPHEFLAQVHDVYAGGPGGEGLVADGDQLLALPEVGAEGHHLASVALDQPAQDDRSVEPAGIRENDLLGIRHRRGSLPADRAGLPSGRAAGSRPDRARCCVARRDTVSVISSPRWAGRQCITSAEDFAAATSGLAELVAAERLQALLALRLLPHADPHVGVEHVGAPGRLHGIAGDRDGAPASPCPALGRPGSGSWPSGQEMIMVQPSSPASSMREWHTLFPSPIHAKRMVAKSTPRSQSVKKSATAWHGCSRSESPLMTGMLAWRARPSTVAWR